MFFSSTKSTKRLRRMLEAISSHDFTLQYSLDNLRGEERLLAMEINDVMTKLRNRQAEQEALYGQFETMLNQVRAALIVEDGHDNVLWMNTRAVKNLCGFRIPRLSMLAAIHQDLPDALNSLVPGQQRLLRLRVSGHDVEWSVTMSQYYRAGSYMRLFSIENMQTVLLQNEVETQRRLVSVLTHEIMNSLSPIISLSDTLSDNLDSIDSDELAQAIAAIHRRSEGLLCFVENYRKLARISQPQKQQVCISALIDGIQRLFPSPHIEYDVKDAAETISMDRGQMEQVLINLLKNAEEACRSTVRLSTHADHPKHQFLITVNDDGEGIIPQVLDRIFVPFFTTKPGGSGIGLSLCRQIVVMHGGNISVSSTPGCTEFTVCLPLG